MDVSAVVINYDVVILTEWLYFIGLLDFNNTGLGQNLGPALVSNETSIAVHDEVVERKERLPYRNIVQSEQHNILQE